MYSENGSNNTGVSKTDNQKQPDFSESYFNYTTS